MKHLFTLLAIALLGAFILAPLSPAQAGDEAGGAATLSSRLVARDHRVQHLKKFLVSYNSPLASEAGKEADHK